MGRKIYFDGLVINDYEESDNVEIVEKIENGIGNIGYHFEVGAEKEFFYKTYTRL